MKYSIIKVLLFTTIISIAGISSKIVYASPQDDINIINSKISILKDQLNELNIKIIEQSEDLNSTTNEIEKRDKIINKVNDKLEKTDERNKENISNLANELTTKLIESKTKSLLSGDKELSSLTIHPLSFSILENNNNGYLNVSLENEILKETSNELNKEKDELLKNQENNENTSKSLTEQKTELENNILFLQNEIIRIQREQEEAARRERILKTYGISVSGSNTDIVETALKYLGTPYVWGGTTPNGFDCSGFVKYVYSQHGIYLSRTTYTQIYDGIQISSSELQPGDLIFPNDGHVGMYIGNGQMIHAPQPGDVVKISYIGSVWKAVRIK